MAGARVRSFAAVAIVAVVGFSLTGCSKSNKSKTTAPNVTAPSQAAQGNGGAGSAGASAPAGGGGGDSAAAGDNTLLANGPACKIVTAADIQAAVGMPLGNITGDISGGPQGATNYHACTWTKDAPGLARPSTSSTEPTPQRRPSSPRTRRGTPTWRASCRAARRPSRTCQSATAATSSLDRWRGDDVITFTKGQQLIQVARLPRSARRSADARAEGRREALTRSRLMTPGMAAHGLQSNMCSISWLT